MTRHLGRADYAETTGQLSLPMPVLVQGEGEDPDQLTIFDVIRAVESAESIAASAHLEGTCHLSDFPCSACEAWSEEVRARVERAKADGCAPVLETREVPPVEGGKLGGTPGHVRAVCPCGWSAPWRHFDDVAEAARTVHERGL